MKQWLLYKFTGRRLTVVGLVFVVIGVELLRWSKRLDDEQK